ncbi:MAG TPA: HD domain-containing phosphohydrolase [Thermoanaerobaculia bacterium]|nr:HD domain-containing phosphohydrolase [Thermoanaerobaculia bacterium]
MLSEIKSLEPQLKQILFGCMEHVQATKAALYLSASPDLNDKTFELVTFYQFNDPARKLIRATDDLVERLAIKRGPFFVNGVATDQRFSEMLFRQGTDRLLATPIYSRGRLVGFIDMRDKAGRKPFDHPDVEAAKRIANDVLSLLGAKNLFGVGPIPLAADPAQEQQRAAAAAPLRQVMTPATPPPPPPALRGSVQPELSTAARATIAAARDLLAKRQLTHAATAKHVLTDRDLEVVRLLLPATLAIPGAVLACFSAIGHPSNPQSIVAIATVTDDAIEMLQSHLQAWLRRTHQPEAVSRPHLVYPFGVQVVPVTAAGISTILSAPVNAQSVEGLVLTVAFERTPEPQAQRALHIFLKQIEQSVDAAIAAGSGRNDRQTIAEKLLEPDFQKYPDLVEHCRQVSMMAQRFAIILELPPAQVECIRLAALVHDAGMRLLDYERLYRKPHVTADELRALAEHPIVGAALVEPLLGAEVAQLVLRHHERVDGKGYPSRMSGNQIPIGARIIQICDAWLAMTARNSYQAPLDHEAAMTRMRDGAGSQFDEQLVARFLRSRTEIGA